MSSLHGYKFPKQGGSWQRRAEEVGGDTEAPSATHRCPLATRGGLTPWERDLRAALSCRAVGKSALIWDNSLGCCLPHALQALYAGTCGPSQSAVQQSSCFPTSLSPQLPPFPDLLALNSAPSSTFPPPPPIDAMAMKFQHHSKERKPSSVTLTTLHSPPHHPMCCQSHFPRNT